MPKENLKRSVLVGGSIETKEFKHVGQTITLSESLKDKWASIPTAPSMTEEEVKLMTFLDDRLGHAKARQVMRIDVMNSSYLQYRSINYYTQLYGAFPSYWNAWGANAFIPRTFEVVEGARAQLKSKTPDFMLEPVQRKYKGNADDALRLARSEWNRSYSQYEAIDALDDAILWGAGLLRNDLIKEVETQQCVSFDDNGNLIYTPETKTTYYGVGSRRVDPYDFFPEPSPDATKVNGKLNKDRGIRYCFVRTITDVEELRTYYKTLKEKGAYGVTDNYQYLKPGGDLTDYKYLRAYIDDLYQMRSDVRYPATVNSLFSSSSMKKGLESSYAEGKIEVWEYFERDRYIVFAMGMILRDSPNPYPHKRLPFSKMNLFDSKTFWSMGYPEIMRWLQILDNTLYDQGLSNIVMNVHKMFAVNSRYLEDEGELVARPFGIVHLKNIPGVKIQDAIQPIKFDPLSADYFNFLTLNKQNIQTLTGQSEFTSGGVTKEAKIERATVANRIAAGSIIRINEIARHFEEDLIADAVEQQLKIAQLYYQLDLGDDDGLDVEAMDQDGKKKYYRYVPENLDKVAEDVKKQYQNTGDDSEYDGMITLDKIQGDFKVIVKGGSSIALDPDDQARLELEFANWAYGLVHPDQIIGRGPDGKPIGAPMFDMVKIATKVAEDVFKQSNAHDLLYKAKPQPQMQEQPGAEGGGGEGGGSSGNGIPRIDDLKREVGIE